MCTWGKSLTKKGVTVKLGPSGMCPGLPKSFMKNHQSCG